jgi:hypothetical protein
MPPSLKRPLWFRRPPLAILAYVAIVVTLIAMLALSETHPGAPFAVLILLVACAGLILGFWLAWLFLVVIEAGNLLIAVFDGRSWSLVLLKALMVALLLSGSTRRHLWWPRRQRVAPDPG